VRHVGREATARLALTWQAPSQTLILRELFRKLPTGFAAPGDLLSKALGNRGLFDDRLLAGLPV
jgi:hypothetical protein